MVNDGYGVSCGSSGRFKRSTEGVMRRQSAQSIVRELGSSRTVDLKLASHVGNMGVVTVAESNLVLVAGRSKLS